MDVACGTGRLGMILNRNFEVTGVDTSKEMLKICPYKNKIIGSAEKLPVKDKYDIVVALRFFFHYEDIEPFLKEFKRVSKKNGFIIFETYSWSPRSIINIKSLGGKIYSHNHKKILEILNKLDLKLIEKRRIFLFSPFVQKKLPFFILKFITKIEEKLPDKFKMDCYWKVQV